MSKPTPGTQYSVQNGDTIERIAAIAYGDASRSAEIIRANPSVIISPGVVIIIPPDDDPTAFTPSKEGLSLFIGGNEVPTESMRIIRSLDSMVNGWTAVIAWQPGDDPAFDKLIRPYSYAPASAFVNKSLAVAGKLYKPSPGLGGRSQLALEGWSFAADLVDSTLKAPYESNNVTLSQRTKEVAAPFNLKVVSDLETDGKFDRVTVTATQRGGDHLLAMHDLVDTVETVRNVHKTARLAAIAPNLDLVISGIHGRDHFAAEGRRGFFTSSIPGAVRAKYVVEAGDKGFQFSLCPIFLAEDLRDQFFPAVASLRKGGISI